jgi:hypothetical protein
MFYNNSGRLNYGCTIRNCIFENNNQNGFISYGNEIYTQCIPNNEGGNIYNNTYYQMPGVKFTNLIDSSVELRNNKKSQSKLTVSKLLGHEREDVTDIYLASFKKSDENIF